MRSKVRLFALLACLPVALLATGAEPSVHYPLLKTIAVPGDGGFDPRWYVFAVIGLALVVDLSRVTISLRAAAEYKSAALRSNAFHFAAEPVTFKLGQDLV